MSEVQKAEGQRQKAIPEGWREVKLGDVVECFSGGTPSRAKPEYYGGSIPWIKSGELNLGDIYSTEETITEAGLKNSSAKIAKANTLLFALYGATAGVIGRTRIDAAINQAILAIEPKSCLKSDFLEYSLSAKVEESLHLTQGGQPNFSAAIVKSLPLLLPPLPEQQKIAAILSTWDDSIATLTNLLAAKRQQKRGLAEALLTGKKRLAGFEGEWESHPLGLLMPQKPKETAGETEYPILSVTVEGIKPQGDHFNKRVASEKTSDYLVVRRGEIAMSGLNFWMGAIDMQTIEDAGIISPAYKVFRINLGRMDSDFARHFIKSEKMRQILLDSSIQGASIVRRNLDMQSLKESEVRIPSLPEQQAIASILSTLDGEIASLEALKAKVQEQKRGLMDELLTGRVRVAR